MNSKQKKWVRALCLIMALLMIASMAYLAITMLMGSL